jgi:hypothetical protein
LQLLRCHLRKINQSILEEETTIIDANHSGTAVDQVGSSHHSAEGQLPCAAVSLLERQNSN